MKNKKQKEFNIPIKVFGNKQKSEIVEDIENEIVPIVIEKDTQTVEIKETEEMENIKENKQKNRKEYKINWVEKKSKEEKIKLMWAIVGSFMVIIIFVWAIFLKYNIMLEKLSLKQLEKEEEWEEVRDNFAKSIEDFQNNLAEVKNGKKDISTDKQISVDKNITNENEAGISALINENASSSTVKDINITQENIEKLKEKLMEKK